MDNNSIPAHFIANQQRRQFHQAQIAKVGAAHPENLSPQTVYNLNHPQFQLYYCPCGSLIMSDEMVADDTTGEILYCRNCNYEFAMEFGS